MRYFCGWHGTVCRAVKSSGLIHLIGAVEEGNGHRRPGKSQPRGLESQPRALDRQPKSLECQPRALDCGQPKGLECQPKAMRPSQWPGKVLKERKFGKIRMKKGRNINKKEVPKFALRILQASHFGARNKCLQTAKMF